MKYKPTIGIEVHAELDTKSKLFCGCKNDSEENKPNLNICPICMAYPGTLPLLNKEAVKYMIKIGLAVKGKIAKETRFDRKHYFYPDIPKGYQISQYKHPIVAYGILNGIDITRVHLEEDTARSNHELRLGSTLVDFNRAGVPLMELVTEPVIHDSETAYEFTKELQRLLRKLGVSKARMEKGEMRLEANISISDSDKLGTKVEVKNLNSFKSIVNAINYEIERQTEVLDNGEDVKQETRGWDENRNKTFLQRSKEDAKDYRYFPEPDIPAVYPYEDNELNPDTLKENIGELPKDAEERYKKYGLLEEHIEIMFENKAINQLFEDSIKLSDDNKDIIDLIKNYIFTDILSIQKTNEEIHITSTQLVDIVKMIKDKKLSSRGAKDLISILCKEKLDKTTIEIAEENNLMQESNEEVLSIIIDKVIKSETDAVKKYKEGKTELLQFLVGMGMKESKGKADPIKLQELFKEKLQ